jgi:MoxR-like ATPase
MGEVAPPLMAADSDSITIRVSYGGLRNDYLSLHGHLDFFPEDVLGGNTDRNAGEPITLELDRIEEPVETDIVRSKNRFRARGIWTRFYAEHDLKQGDLIEIRRLGGRRFQVSVLERGGGLDWLSLTSKEAVLQAIREFDELGREPFLEKYGYGHAKQWHLIHDGQPYDSKAIYGVAWGYEHPEKGPLYNHDFTGGEGSVVRKLQGLGFEVEKEGGSAPEVECARGARLFFFTAAGRRAREHLDKSLRQGIPIDDLSGALNRVPELEAHAHDGVVYAWGARAGANAERRWERLQPGDIGLVYSDGRFLLRCEVFAKLKDDDLARSIWGEDEDGNSWACMSFLDAVQPVDIDRADLAGALGYKDNYVPQGFEIPHDDVQGRIRESYGGPAGFIEALSARAARPRVWWVNQNQTYQQEREGGFLWAPKRNRAGRTQAHWDALTRATHGDTVLSYVGGEIAAASEVVHAAEDAAPPSEHFSAWEDDGRRLDVTYREVAPAIPLADIPPHWRVEAGGPFDRNGGVKQGYLFPLPDEFVARLASRFPQLGLEPTMTPTDNRLTVDALRATAEDPRFNLRLDDSLYAALVAALESGKHVVLTGPPGTAKTTLAQIAGETASRLGLCTGCVLTTATADWTTYETIGGLRPNENGQLEFEFGHFLKAIQANQWLVIDELNRSQFDRAFGQLFTVLSGQPVTLPYERRDSEVPLTLVPSGSPDPGPGADVLPVPEDWRIIATMNVFDKGLLFDMSYALMRRFAFIEVPSPDDAIFRELIRDAAGDQDGAYQAAEALLRVRDVKDIGPATYLDIARYCAERLRVGALDQNPLRFQAFYSYLLPQFEGITDEEGEQLLRVLIEVCGGDYETAARETLHDVLGVELGSVTVQQPVASPEDGTG